MKRKVLVFTITFVITFSLAFSYLWLRTEERIPGTVTTKLPVRCEIVQFGLNLQPVFTIALACPRMDMIRLWPLPVQQPWFEDFDLYNVSLGILEEQW